MALHDRNSAFKRTASMPARVAKSDQTTEAVKLIIAAETKARDAKTARLRELRLAKEAADAAEKAAATAPAKKKTVRKTG